MSLLESPQSSPITSPRMGDYYGGRAEVKAEVDAEDPEQILIDIENVHKTYLLGLEGVPALRGVSMSIKKGEFVVIFGTSGGGKTTLLNIIGTIDKPTKGKMKLSGIEITSKTSDAVFSHLRLRKIGFVFQTFNLLSSLTAIENVEMPMILAGDLGPKERRSRAEALLNKVGMGLRLDHLPSQLSGGEQQRVTIARAISNSPELLLLDEPTGDLDSMNTCIAIKLLTDLNRDHGITLVMVTHDVGLKNFADRVIWMSDGKILRVETISATQRTKKFEELESDLERYRLGNKSVRRPEFKNTELRRPTDYHTHPNHQSHDPISYNFENEFGKRLEDITLEDYEQKTNLIGPREVKEEIISVKDL
eukprot:TRINITY_DN822_c0_g1_i1.p1 TRINITY_DN822_c0_g1~~TRINITY_DN822_c0_g1_i1.p1  ORF type:complete len:363 (-),score=52.76 TRINITY_DN822_c0_g1_i1:104-1192(-)